MATCEHVTCNSTNDYEYEKCQEEATHRISWPNGESQIACELHTKEYKDILKEMAEYGMRLPQIDRLEL